MAIRWWPLPTVEPRARGCDVQHDGRSDPGPLPPVLARVQKHVRERMPHFARRAQHAEVVAPEQYGPFAPEDAVHCPREPDSHRLHPAPERVLSGGFHDQMYVIALDRVVADAELAALAACADPR